MPPSVFVYLAISNKRTLHLALSHPSHVAKTSLF